MFYEENRHLEEEDIGFESPIYNINLYDKSFLISIGRERKLVQKKNTFYFPIYLLNNTQVQSQIGAFEFESSKDTAQERAKPYFDSTGDIDLNRIRDPIFYSFANYDYFNSIMNTISPVRIKELEAIYIKEKAEKYNEDSDDESSFQEPHPFELLKEDLKKPSESVQKTQKVLNQGVFTINKLANQHKSLSEESKEDAQKEKEDYIQSPNSKWIEKFMKNNKFNIIETIKNGDCLFDSVRIAYEQIGQETTIAKLRALVAKEVTEKQFLEYRELYLTFFSEIADTDKELRRLQTENRNLKERYKQTIDKIKKKEIMEQANLIKAQYADLTEQQKSNNTNLTEFAHMKDITTIDKFREYVLSPSYWADDWAIDVLEKELNMKFIIFSEIDYDEDDENNIVRCTLTSNSLEGDFTPDFYVMVSYSGNHYKLISYSNAFIFTFREIPYDVKTMIIIKCMERNSGRFSQIPDFKELKTKLGVSEDDSDEDEGELLKGGGLYRLDNSTVFAFYNKANSSDKPGKGSNEKITSDKINDFTDLSVKKDWRKKLDDDYVSTFTLDNKKWKTVEHYYQAAKFKKHNPHFYNQFSLDDTSSDIAKDVELAKAAGSQKGIFKRGKKEIPVRPYEIKIDPDFYGTRRKEEREKALYAKFSQSDELKKIILLTKNAILKQFIPKRRPQNDISLMIIRQRLQMEN